MRSEHVRAAEALRRRIYIWRYQVAFEQDVWQETRTYFREAPDTKQRLQTAVSQIAPVRNEIAHVREIDRDRLLRADLACSEVIGMLNRT